ncbi:NETR-like protein, partial [Mya arenaria]
MTQMQYAALLEHQQTGPYTPIRLTGSSNSTGTVEAFYDGSWRTFCSSNFGYKEAAVICRRLNFKVGEPVSYYGRGFLYNLQCTGTETDITECGNPNHWDNGYWYCNSGSDRKAGVQCSNDRVRLQNGINKYQGRVEFLYYGVWGTVCSQHFDKYDAQVICRLAHVPGNQTATIYEQSRYGSGSGSLIVEDLKCNGTEDDLDECDSFPWSEESAQPPCNIHDFDVGVSC